MENKIKLTRLSVNFSLNEIDPIFGTITKKLFYKKTEIDSIKPIEIDKSLKNVLHLNLDEFLDFLETKIGK